MTNTPMIITVALAVAGTVATRFLPYVLFSEGKPVPSVVQYLGHALPPAVFGLLVVYCLRNVAFTSGNFGLPELISLAAVAALYTWRRDMLAPMVVGTAVYMLLIRVM